jgi:hypothetical protein
MLNKALLVNTAKSCVLVLEIYLEHAENQTEHWDQVGNEKEESETGIARESSKER